MKEKKTQKLLAYRDVQWTDAIDRAIGTDTDAAIGARLGISPRSIITRRRKLGMKSEARIGVRWTKAMDKMLGTMHDTDLAKLQLISPYEVRRRRSEIGIAAYQPPDNPEPMQTKSRVALTDRQIEALGTADDPTLAKRWGISVNTVRNTRIRLGIPSVKSVDDIQWTKGMLNLLGDVSDAAIAREFDIGHTSVKIKRIEMRILPFGNAQMDTEPEIPKHVIPLIGKWPDKQISDQFGVTRIHLRIFRALHAIPKADYDRPTLHDWTDAQTKALGTMSDGAMARKFRIPRSQVMHRRRTLGIAPFDRQAPVRWTRERIGQLGTNPDHILARKWRIPQRSVREKRESLGIAKQKLSARHWTKKELSQLGTVLDTELASILGVSQTAVAKKRKELGIPPLKSSAPYEWSAATMKRLGTIPDDELALELGLSYQFVGAKRNELKIPAKRRSSLKWTKEIIRMMGTVSDRIIAAKLGCTSGLVRQKRTELRIAPFTK